MQFSIIVPVYNLEMYMEECLDSVLCQTFHDYEIILIDDGSTDNSGKICDEYALKHKCIQVIHQENQGQAQARNLGIGIAKGDYLLFLDGDDYWYCKENLSKLAHCICEGNGKWDIIAYGGVSAYFNGEKTIYNNKHMNRLKADDSNEGYTAESFLSVHLKENTTFYWYPYLYAFSKNIFEGGKLQFPSNRKYEDFFLIWRALLKADKIAAMPDIFYAYRSHREGSTTATVSCQNLWDFLYAIDANIRDAERMVEDRELKSLLLSNFSQNFYECCTLSTYLGKEERNKMFSQLKAKRKFMDYAKGKKYAFVRTMAKIVGFKNMFQIMHFRSMLLRYKDEKTIK